jgi:hypothetical protein
MASATVGSPLGFDRPVSTAYTHIYQSPLFLREKGAKPAARPVSVFLGTILIDGGHTNVAFGDADGKGLYLTTGHGLARIRLNAPAV